MKKGIDLSYANKVTDWQKVKNTIDFVILRAGYGKNNIDQNFVPYVKACTELGIPTWLYWFSYAFTSQMAANEADYCIAQAQKHGIMDGRITFDFEYDSIRYAESRGVNVTPNLVMAMTVSFCNKVQKSGYIPVVYTNKDFASRYFDIVQLKALGYEIWYAYYNKELDRDDVTLWQYSSNGTVPGIAGSVDMNYMLADMESGYGWQNENDHWWYQNKDGSYPRNDWLEIDGKWYRFDAAGWMQTGWHEEQDKWYYLKPDGSMASGELLEIFSAEHGNELYAFAKDGHMLRTTDRGNLI